MTVGLLQRLWSGNIHFKGTGQYTFFIGGREGGGGGGLRNGVTVNFALFTVELYIKP